MCHLTRRLGNSSRGLLILAACAGPALAWGAAGNLMKLDIATHVQMAGMANMPTSTLQRQICTAAGKPDPRQFVQHDGSCIVSNYRQVGQTISYHMACKGPAQASGDGRFELLGQGNFRGQLEMSSQAGGHAIQMQTTYSGQRVGSCTYVPSKAG